MSRDLIYNDNLDQHICPFCREVVKELVVTVKGWGKVNIKSGAVGELEITHYEECECPYCGKEVDY